MPKTIPSRFTDKQKAAIIVLAKTLTVPEIAAKTRFAEARIRRVLLNAKVNIKPARYAPLQGVDIKAEADRLGSYSAVADAYGVSRQAVQKRAMLE